MQSKTVRAQQKSGLPSAPVGKVTAGTGAMALVRKEELGPKRVKLAPESVL